MLPKQSVKRIIVLFVLLVSPLLAVNIHEANAQGSAIPTDPEAIAAGDVLYQQNCKTCHNVETKLIGPALKNVYDRQELPWIIKFVQNSTKVIQSGDEYAVQLYEEYNNTMMTTFDFLTDEDVTNIMAYIKDQTDNPPAAAAVPAQGGADVAAQPAGVPAAYLNAIIVIGVILLVALLIIMFMIVSTLGKYINLREDIPEDEKQFAEQWNPFALARNKAFIGIVVAIVTTIAAKGVIDNLYAVGVQEGYAPKQPIAYSHKVHAGDYGIDCNYCHTGVTKSKNANIPSANICMNCHMSIVEGTNTGTAEIQKIYDAIENNEPIEWVRIHNLPDHAYFNHQQHYAVGGLECQTCHGPIEEMEVVYQYSNLTMGWCINCHRDTEINTKDNAYYDELLRLHEEESDKPFTVEVNGGLECAKCHY